MLHFEIKSIEKNTILNNFFVKECNSEYYRNFNYSSYNYISQIKHDIEEKNKAWDIFKKVTNPYEYIHSNYKNNRISKYKPLSRAFYKMTEIIHFFNLIEVNNNESLNTFHLAEGPGGFIEATQYYRKNKNNPYIYNKDNYYGMTLVDDNDKKIPGWNKSTHFLKNSQNIKIEYGESGDGDLCKVVNLDKIFYNHKNRYNIVTGDGGFDFSQDFNKQESLAMKLILCEIIYGIILTKKDGHFVIKVFDLFTKCSYEIIFLLSCLFKEVYICKPNTSRYGNSEKYIVCKKKCKDITDSAYSILRSTFNKIINFETDFSNISILNTEVPIHIKNAIQEINCIFVERQLENINSTLSLIQNKNRNKVIEYYNVKHIEMCIEWCKNHNIQYNDIKKQNIFT